MGKPHKKSKPGRRRQQQPEWRLECNEDHTNCKAVKVVDNATD